MTVIEQVVAQLPIADNQVRLRLFSEQDITEQYIGWLNDADVVRFSNQRFIFHNRQTSEAYLQSLNPAASVLLLIESKVTGEPLGTMSLHASLHHGAVDIGILLGEKSVWGKGVGSRAWLLAIGLLGNSSKCRKITAGTLAINYPMLKLMEKAGMSADGVRRAQEIVDGTAVDIHYFSLFPKHSDGS